MRTSCGIPGDGQLQFQEALDNGPSISTSFSDNRFSEALSMIAKSFRYMRSLVYKQQIFYVNYAGGIITTEVLQNQNEMLGVVSKGLKIQRCDGWVGHSSRSQRLVSANLVDHLLPMAMALIMHGEVMYSVWVAQSMVPNSMAKYPSWVSPIHTTSMKGYHTNHTGWSFILQSWRYGWALPSDLSYVLPKYWNSFYDTHSSNSPLGLLK